MKAGLEVFAVVMIVLAVLILCSVVKKVCRKMLKGTKSVIDVKGR